MPPSDTASVCPLCGRDNRCGIADPDGCWCQQTDIPLELLALVPSHHQGLVCICPDCADAWHQNPSALMHHVRTVDQLIQLSSTGVRAKFVFFWGHTPAADGSVTKSCFSQWWEAPFQVDGITYPTAEHYMMTGKAQLFGDAAIAEKILTAKHPKQAKALGRQVANFDEAAWNEARFDIVVAANFAKFSQNPPLKEFLLQTGTRVLVEASPVDRIWGIGLASDDERAEKPSEWKGLNLLGFALMEARDRLAKLPQ